ncbi:hypothetical protein CPB83DRAFT_929919 [Crepidotus variabilis]|uniref:F-box domain-containing protein n=1 Tax=Crepidotus variabilis TaxID=179855 RepID=A0A9P6JQB0_9AGAR|nr:hypothetical protein CPB83DRAFT_929919 [Crepidotus variabilis]
MWTLKTKECVEIYLWPVAGSFVISSLLINHSVLLLLLPDSKRPVRNLLVKSKSVCLKARKNPTTTAEITWKIIHELPTELQCAILDKIADLDPCSATQLALTCQTLMRVCGVHFKSIFLYTTVHPTPPHSRSLHISQNIDAELLLKAFDIIPSLADTIQTLHLFVNQTQLHYTISRNLFVRILSKLNNIVTLNFYLDDKRWPPEEKQPIMSELSLLWLWDFNLNIHPVPSSLKELHLDYALSLLSNASEVVQTKTPPFIHRLDVLPARQEYSSWLPWTFYNTTNTPPPLVKAMKSFDCLTPAIDFTQLRELSIDVRSQNRLFLYQQILSSAFHLRKLSVSLATLEYLEVICNSGKQPTDELVEQLRIIGSEGTILYTIKLDVYATYEASIGFPLTGRLSCCNDFDELFSDVKMWPALSKLSLHINMHAPTVLPPEEVERVPQRHFPHLMHRPHLNLSVQFGYLERP